jgi:hypothetical protein
VVTTEEAPTVLEVKKGTHDISVPKFCRRLRDLSGTEPMVSLVVVLKLCGLYAQRGQSRIHRARIDMGRLSVASLVRAAERHTLRTTAQLKGQNAKGRKREGLNEWNGT